MILGLLVALSSGEIPLPAYDRALAEAQWHALNERLEASCRFVERAGAVICGDPEALDAVIADGESWQRSVTRDASITYLVGLAWRYKGDENRARAAWEAATALDPDYRAPWYDLGELYLASGDLDGAERAFSQVARLTPEGPEAWLAPWRLAEVAAFRHDAPAFERHLREALRHGFTFERVAGLPNWKGFLRDPAIGPSVEKLIVSYGTQRDLDSLRAP